MISSGSDLIFGDGDAKDDWVTGTDGGTSSAELSAPSGCEVTELLRPTRGLELESPGRARGFLGMTGRLGNLLRVSLVELLDQQSSVHLVTPQSQTSQISPPMVESERGLLTC